MKLRTFAEKLMNRKERRENARKERKEENLFVFFAKNFAHFAVINVFAKVLKLLTKKQKP